MSKERRVLPVWQRLPRPIEVVKLPVGHALGDEVFHQPVDLVPGRLLLDGVPLSSGEPVLVLGRQLPHPVLVHRLSRLELLTNEG